MRVLIAPDKFRGSLSAAAAAEAIARGVRRADPGATCVAVPMADGGEGFVEALVAATGVTRHEVEVCGPLGDPVRAEFGVLGAGESAVLAMAAASGHQHVPPDRRDPTRTTTRGTGDLIRAARAPGIGHLIVGIGGSATNDGGAGMAQALGYRLLDARGAEIGPGGGALADLHRIDASGVDPLVRSTRIEVACDVANPLCGPDGASHVYGPQKGATPEQVLQLERNLGHLAAIIRRDLGVDVRDLAGGGAAGGLGAGLVAFMGATLRSGADLVIEATGLRDHLRDADLCITGEGRVDATSVAGKTVGAVVRAARAAGVPALVLAGSVGPGGPEVVDHGATAVFSIAPGPTTLAEALEHADAWLAWTAEQAVRLFLAGSRGR